MSLTSGQKDFIINLSNEMRTQDTRCTAQPYGLILTEEVIEVRGEDHGSHCGAHFNESEYYDFNELVEAISEYYEDDDEHPLWVDKLNECSDIQDIEHAFYGCPCDGNEPSVFWYDRTQVPTLMKSNFFLTEKGYEEYVRKDRHNLTKPQSYGIHLRRNDEMARVIEIIHTIADQLKQEPQS